MVTNDWFQTWGPPSHVTNQQPFNEPFHLRNFNTSNSHDFGHHHAPLPQKDPLQFIYTILLHNLSDKFFLNFKYIVGFFVITGELFNLSALNLVYAKDLTNIKQYCTFFFLVEHAHCRMWIFYFSLNSVREYQKECKKNYRSLKTDDEDFNKKILRQARIFILISFVPFTILIIVLGFTLFHNFQSTSDTVYLIHIMKMFPSLLFGLSCTYTIPYGILIVYLGSVCSICVIYIVTQIKFQFCLLTHYLKKISQIRVENENYLLDEDYQHFVFRRLRFCIQHQCNLQSDIVKGLQFLQIVIIIYWTTAFPAIISCFYFLYAKIDTRFNIEIYFLMILGIAELVIYSIIGQLVKDESIRFYETLCECPWYYWNKKNKSLFQMMLLYSKKSTIIACFGYIELNMAFIVTVTSSNLGPNSFLAYMLALSVAKPKQRYHSRNHAISIETTGPFKTWYYWNTLDFAYPDDETRNRAIFHEEFIPENNLPLGVEVYENRIFVSMPKWKPGVPATLAVIPRVPKESSPKLIPYPNWKWHNSGSCNGITSVFRVQADSCGRLWVLDSGLINVTIKPKQICPPKVLIFDLNTDVLIVEHILPDEFIKEDSLYSNILVDIRGDCENVHAYLTDVWRFGIVVFSLEHMRSWRVTDHLFFPEPLSAAYKVHHLDFQWTDGIFGLALSPYSRYQKDRILYFHPMSSFREFYVKTSVICNETGWSEVKDAFKVIGQSRGKSGHVSTSGIDRKGIMFYNLVTRDTIGCWDTRKPYKRSNLGVVAQDSETLVFPNDLKIDQEKRQSVWILTNKLPFYLYEGLDQNKINFRIMSAYVDEAIQNTICDPNISNYDTFVEFNEVEDCYG